MIEVSFNFHCCLFNGNDIQYIVLLLHIYTFAVIKALQVPGDICQIKVVFCMKLPRFLAVCWYAIYWDTWRHCKILIFLFSTSMLIQCFYNFFVFVLILTCDHPQFAVIGVIECLNLKFEDNFGIRSCRYTFRHNRKLWQLYLQQPFFEDSSYSFKQSNRNSST